MTRLSNVELIQNIVENYLEEHFQLSIEDLERWYGHRLCQFVTKLRGLDFNFFDIVGSQTVKFVTDEINLTKEYYFDNIGFQPGDIVIDIGANVGMVSIFLAKKYPFLKIYSYEPVYLNYCNLTRNIQLNKIPEGIITPIRKAVNGDGSPVSIMFDPRNSGGSALCKECKEGFILKKEDTNIEAITLEQIFKEHNIEKVKLLKIDCEGGEYDILKSCAPKYLKKIEVLRGEFHEDIRVNPDQQIDELIAYCQKYIKYIDVTKCKPRY